MVFFFIIFIYLKKEEELGSDIHIVWKKKKSWTSTLSFFNGG